MAEETDKRGERQKQLEEGPALGVAGTPAQGGRKGGNLQRDIGSRDEQKRRSNARTVLPGFARKTRTSRVEYTEILSNRGPGTTYQLVEDSHIRCHPTLAFDGFQSYILVPPSARVADLWIINRGIRL